MPVRYENFIVDPWKGAREANVMNLRRDMMRQDDEQFKSRNELARRGLEQGQMNADRDFSLRRKASEQLGKQYETNQAKSKFDLYAKQAALMYKLGLGVKDNQTYQDARSIVKGFVESGMAPQEWYDRMSETYDPQKHKAAMKALEPFAQTEPDGSVPASVKEYMFAREDGYKGNYEQWVNRGKSPGAGSGEPSAKDKIAGRKGIADVYKMLEKIGYEFGSKMPREYLDQINGYLKDMGEPILTEREVRTKKPWDLFGWFPANVTTEYVPGGDGEGTTPAAPPSGGTGFDWRSFDDAATPAADDPGTTKPDLSQVTPAASGVVASRPAPRPPAQEGRIAELERERAEILEEMDPKRVDRLGDQMKRQLMERGVQRSREKQALGLAERGRLSGATSPKIPVDRRKQRLEEIEAELNRLKMGAAR